MRPIVHADDRGRVVTRQGTATARPAEVVPVALAAFEWAATFSLIVAMLALAGSLGTHAIIFPEAAALAMGVWVLALPAWAASRWRVAVLPPLCALLGVVLLRLGQSGAATAILGAGLALLALHVFDSRLVPALSAAMLPIVFGVREWGYPLAVLAVSLVIASLMPALAGRRRPSAPREAPGRLTYASAIAAGAGALYVAMVAVDRVARPRARHVP